MLKRKRPRMDIGVVDQPDNLFKRAAEIVYAVSHFKEFSEGPAGQTKLSDAVNINGLNWRVKIEHREGVGIHLHCDGDRNDITWACRAAVQFTVVPIPSSSGSSVANAKVGELDDFDIYRAGSETTGFREFAKFADLMDERNGVYSVEADTVTFKAELIVGRRKQMPGISTEDALLVNGEAVYVNKHVLAGYSQFFRPLFFGENAEEVPKVQIEDPDAVEQFERFVIATHDPWRIELNDECVEEILLLANQFQFESVVNHCFEFLMDDSAKSNIRKFRLADQCGNVIMKKNFLNAMTKDDFAWKNYFRNRFDEDKMGVGAKEELKERHKELRTLDEGGENA
uniref:BTB domain-containing protein n=1 Tax=Globodera rostochiensis TaxID=31243 RepID=A0A914HVC6_GLORO